MSQAPNVGRSAAWSAIDYWTQQVGLLLTLVVVGNIVGPEAVGVLTLGQVAVTLMMAFLLDGFSDALIQRAEITPAHVDSAFWLLLALGCATALVLAGLSPLLALVFDAPVLVPVLILLGLGLPFVGISATYQGLLQRRMRFRALALRTVLAQSAGLATGIGLALEGFGVFALVGAFLVSRGLDALVLAVLSARLPGLMVTRAALNDIIGFGLHRVSTQAVGVLVFQIDRLTLGLFVGPTAVGLYSIAERITTSLTHGVGGVVMRVAFPMLSTAQGDPSAFKQSGRAFLQAANVAVFPVFVGLALVADQLVAVLFTDSWAGVGTLLMLLAFANLPHASNLVLLAGINARGRPDVAAQFAVVVMVARVAASLAAAQFGVEAVAIANITVTAASLPLMAWWLRPHVTVSWGTLGRALRVPAAAASAMAGVVLAVEYLLSGWPLLIQLAGMVLAGAASYPLVLHLLAPRLLREELPKLLTRSAADFPAPSPH